MNPSFLIFKNDISMSSFRMLLNATHSSMEIFLNFRKHYQTLQLAMHVIYVVQWCLLGNQGTLIMCLFCSSVGFDQNLWNNYFLKHIDIRRMLFGFFWVDGRELSVLVNLSLVMFFDASSNQQTVFSLLALVLVETIKSLTSLTSTDDL